MIDILEISNKIKNAGGNLYLVGGALRDCLLGFDVHDKDYCVTGITSDEFVKLFPEANIRGKSFEVFDIENTEFAMARKEKKTNAGHKGFEITTGKEITIEEDLARRDITINSMAIEVLTNKLIDPYGGKNDLENRIIKATTNAFKEDPLRVYRVARFASQLVGADSISAKPFTIEPNTIKLMNELKTELNTLSAQRVFTEFKKALSTNKPSIFFDVLRKANVLEIHFKEIHDLIGSLQPEKFHPEGDSYNHTMIVVDKSVEYTKELEIRFACLVHDLGKGITPEEEYPHHYEHDKTGIKLVKDLCNKLKTPISWEKCGITAVKEHMKGGIFYKLRPGKKVEFIETAAKSILGLIGMEIVILCDKSSTQNNPKNEVEFRRIGEKMLKEINGKYIEQKYNIKPDKSFAKKLHEERIKWLINYLQ